MELNTGSIYTIDSCTNFSTEYQTCLQWTTVFSLSKTEAKELLASSLWNVFVFTLVLMMLGWITKVLFAKMFGGKK